MIETGCQQLVENNFGHNIVLEFVNNVTDFWPMIKDIPNKKRYVANKRYINL